MIGGDHCLRAVRAYLLVSAIVQKDYVAATNLFRYLALDYRSGRRVPVVAGYVPHDWLEAKFAGYAKHGGAASSEGRAEEIGGFANRILQSIAALSEFLPDLGFALEDQKRMGEGVVADNVAGLDDRAGNLRLLLDVASNQKKSGVNVVFREDFQQALGVRVVGAIVVGQCDLARAARQSDESSSIPLRRRGHGLITRGNRGCGSDGAH